ncbi:MAG: response regulator [Planctomycetota bacterium]|nr:response regulator [Planctomycetota bacterium]
MGTTVIERGTRELDCRRGVLVVEDDEDVRDALRMLIEDETVQPVVGAADGREAIDWLEDHPPPCLIVLDLMMPVINGWQVLEWLAAHPCLRRVPVVVCSAAAPDRGRLAVAPHRLAAYLQKPLRGEDLMAVVSRHCS